jgi:hypothetical protein
MAFLLAHCELSRLVEKIRGSRHSDYFFEDEASFLHRAFVVLGRALIALSLPAVLLVAAVDPFVGTWKLDRDRSTYTSGAPVFMLATIRIESGSKGLKSTALATDGEGSTGDFTFNCPLTGSPCKVVASTARSNSSGIEMISLKRVDEHTITGAGMMRGKVVFTDVRRVSSDGETMTVTRRGTTPEGAKYESMIVLVRSH